MKINAIGELNHLSYNRNIKTKQMTFGHYLDSEKYNKEQRLSSLDSQISNINSRIWSDEYDFNRKSSALDDEIESAENELEASENKVAKLKSKVDNKEDDIYDLESVGYRLQNQAEENNKTIKQLEINQKNVIEKIRQSNNELQQKLTTDFQTTSEKLKYRHEASVKSAVGGIKNSLIQNVINPIIQSMEGNTSEIPSSIYIEDETNIPEPIFSWLVKQTDSNYAKLHTVNLKDEKQFISLIKKISILAARKYEETGTRTFTLLGDVEQPISSTVNSKFFKDLLINSEKLYHNILVLVSKVPYSEIMKTSTFATNVRAEKTFYTDQKLGRNSLIEFVSKRQYLGEDLLAKMIKR